MLGATEVALGTEPAAAVAAQAPLPADDTKGSSVTVGASSSESAVAATETTTTVTSAKVLGATEVASGTGGSEDVIMGGDGAPHRNSKAGVRRRHPPNDYELLSRRGRSGG